MREGCDCPNKSVHVVSRAGTHFLLFKRDLPKTQGRKPPGHVLEVATWLVLTVFNSGNVINGGQIPEQEVVTSWIAFPAFILSQHYICAVSFHYYACLRRN